MEIAIIIAGAMLAGFVQGLSGFGFGMVAMSIWIWALPPQLAAVLTVFGAMTGQLMGAVAVRRRVNWRAALPFLVGGVLGLPLGLSLLAHLDVVVFKAVLGAFLVAWCPIMLLSSRLPAVSAGGRWGDALAGAAGGAMSALGGLSGVVPTLWTTLRGFEKSAQRNVIQSFNLAILGLTFVAYVASGQITGPMVPSLLVVAPAMLIPTLAGARLYVAISERAFKRVVLGLLTASGAALLVSSLPALLQRATA